MNADALLDYTHFVTERHRIWEARQAGAAQPWTADPILAARKFTNVFRILDHDTQWLVQHLLEGSQRDVLMRCFLFRHTGRVKAWETLENRRFTYRDLDSVYNRWWGHKMLGGPIFTSAYLVYPQSSEPGTEKLKSIIDLTRRLFDPHSPDDIVPDFMRATSQKGRYMTLRRNRGVADFMSMQVLTDWGYTQWGYREAEDEFVVLGPGARRGIAEIYGRANADDLYRARSALAEVGMPQLRLGPLTREPSLMDLQNTMCEFSKYVRYQSRPATARPYPPVHRSSAPVYPDHWRKQ